MAGQQAVGLVGVNILRMYVSVYMGLQFFKSDESL